MREKPTKNCPDCGTRIYRYANTCLICWNKRRTTPEEIAKRFWNQVRKTTNCWIWEGNIDRNGYGRFCVNHKNYNASRYSLILAGIDTTKVRDTCHRCDNPPCVNPDHLFMGTHQENISDMFKKGRANRPKGIRHPRCKLTESQVIKIRSLKEIGETYKSLASAFNVSRRNIDAIVKHKSWKHIP